MGPQISQVRDPQSPGAQDVEHQQLHYASPSSHLVSAGGEGLRWKETELMKPKNKTWTLQESDAMATGKKKLDHETLVAIIDDVWWKKVRSYTNLIIYSFFYFELFIQLFILGFIFYLLPVRSMEWSRSRSWQHRTGIVNNHMFNQGLVTYRIHLNPSHLLQEIGDGLINELHLHMQYNANWTQDIN